MDIQLISVDPITKLATVTMQPKTVTGIMKLMQVVVLSLLTVPGKDALDPDKGGGLPELIGMNISVNDSTEIFSEVATRVAKTQAEVIASQVGLDLIPSEKLKEIQIVSLDQSQAIDEVAVRLRIINELRQTSDVVV